MQGFCGPPPLPIQGEEGPVEGLQGGPVPHADDGDALGIGEAVECLLGMAAQGTRHLVKDGKVGPVEENPKETKPLNLTRRKNVRPEVKEVWEVVRHSNYLLTDNFSISSNRSWGVLANLHKHHPNESLYLKKIMSRYILRK